MFFSTRKIVSLLLFSFVLLGSGSALAQTGSGGPAANVLKPGERSTEVKALQQILKEIPSAGFNSSSTGFFGPATQKALQAIQIKCGVPLTGQLDEPTEKCIFPAEHQVTVLSPNGGETWDRGQLQTIKWKAVAIAPATPAPTVLPLPTTTVLPAPQSEMPPYPLWAKASIDLFRQGPAILMPCKILPDGTESCPPQGVTFVKHLAVVNLFDGSYSWKITRDIPNESDYLVRVTVGRGIWPLYLQDKGQSSGALKANDIWPSRLLNWDQSDAPFTVTGNVPPSDSDLKQVLELLDQISQQLAKVSAMLRDIISRQ